MSSLLDVDLNGDRGLDQQEYSALVSDFSDNALAASLAFSALPYIIRENFDWTRGDSLTIDIRAAEVTPQSNGSARLVELARACRRTEDVIESALSGNNRSNFTEHCYSALYIADSDNDTRLNRTEFASMVKYFQGLDSSELGFEYLDYPFVTLFELKAAGTGTIDVAGSEPGVPTTADQDLSLSDLCRHIADALEDARVNYVFLTSCSSALVHANVRFSSPTCGTVKYPRFAGPIHVFIKLAGLVK